MQPRNEHPIDTILFPVDIDDWTRVALPHVAAWAKRFEAAVVVLHVVDFADVVKYGYPFESMSSDAIEAKARAAAHDYLQALIEHPVLDGVSASIDIRFAGGIAPTIATAAAESKADLVMLTNTIRTVMGRIALGSVVEQLLHSTKGPLVTCTGPRGEVPTVPHEPPTYDRIMVGCDFGGVSARTVAAAARLATAFGASVDLVHVTDERDGPSGLPRSGERLADHERQVLDALVRHAEALGSVTSRVHSLFGHPARELIAYANRIEADLIVMATKGPDSAADHLLGSTTERVLRGARCPVFIEHG